MYTYLTDLQHDLLTKYREHDRANDFARRDEYLALLDEVNEQQASMDRLYDALDRIEVIAGHALVNAEGVTITDDTPQVDALTRISAIIEAIHLGTYDPNQEGPIA